MWRERLVKQILIHLSQFMRQGEPKTVNLDRIYSNTFLIQCYRNLKYKEIIIRDVTTREQTSQDLLWSLALHVMADLLILDV